MSSNFVSQMETDLKKFEGIVLSTLMDLISEVHRLREEFREQFAVSQGYETTDAEDYDE